MPASQVA